MTGGPATVRALPVESSGQHARAVVGEWARERFWFVPTAMVLGAALLALIVAEADRVLPEALRSGVPVNPESADDVLGIIAASTLTFVGVVFTISLVALQLASAQLSPRVIRTFVRARVTRLAFGTFLATYTFAMAALVVDGALQDEDAQSRALTVAVVLVVASVVVFLVYVTATMRLMQVSRVIDVVAVETRAAAAAVYPPEDRYLAVPPPDLVAAPRTLVVPDVGRRSRRGVVLGVDRGRLARLASGHGCVIELLVPVGDFLSVGRPVVAVHGGNRVPDVDAVLRCFHLGRARTLYQDPLFGVRQLVDVAAQALSPALNQPTTAVMVVEQLEDILLLLARRPSPTGVFADADGSARLVEPSPTWGVVLDLAWAEILSYGAGSAHVLLAAVAVHDRLLVAVPDDRRPELVVRRRELDALVEALPARERRVEAVERHL